METTKIALFKGKQIRKILFQGEWWLSIVDVIEALTDSTQPSKYWTAMKLRVNSEDRSQLSTICRQLKLPASDGKKYETDCANTEEVFRIIQSIPSFKKELFKKTNSGRSSSVEFTVRDREVVGPIPIVPTLS